MKTTITLSIDTEIAERVKQIKAETGMLPSHLFTNAVKAVKLKDGDFKEVLV